MAFSAAAFCVPALAEHAVADAGVNVASPARIVRGSAPRDVGGIAFSQLPAQAQATDRLIHQGGPFPYPKDGIVFANRERALPRQARGFYHEYTVPTPGSHDRGARRIVCGGNPPSRPEACYYTDDHYRSFRRIEP